jgi:hypothetical protein
MTLVRGNSQLGFWAKIFLSIISCTAVCAGPPAAWQWRNPLPQGNNLNAVTYGAGLFVAVGESGAIVTSSNGIDWRNQNSGTSTLRAVAYGDGLFVAVGDDGVILSSTTGVHWTNHESRTSNSLFAVTYGAGRFVALGHLHR